TGRLSCRWFRFQRKVMESRFCRGQGVLVSGKVTFWGVQAQMAHPDVEVLTEEDEPESGGILPLYAEVDGVPKRKVRAIVQGLAGAAAHRSEDPLPEAVRARQGLVDLSGAVHRLHLPEPDGFRAHLSDVRRRFIFDELFVLQVALTRARSER